MISHGVQWGPMDSKNRKNSDFHELHVFESFFVVVGGFRSARGLLNTIRVDLDTAGAGLTFPYNEIAQYSCFWECQCTRIDLQNLPFCPGTPQKTFIFSLIFQNDNSLKYFCGILEFESLRIWNYGMLNI